MANFCFSFICIIILIWPAQLIIRYLADFIKNNMSDTPFLSFLVKAATGQIKAKHGYAKPEEIRHSVRVATVISGISTIIIFPHLLVFSIFWVFAIIFLSSFVDSN